MSAREDEILFLEAQAEIDAEWEEFMKEYQADRAPEEDVSGS